MKKLLYIIPLLFGMTLTSCYDEDIEKINSRLDAIENTTIASINEKIATINEKINQIKEQISALEEADKALQEQIDEQNSALKEANKALQEQIDALKGQLNSAKQDITEAYQNAIALAILTNNGEIDERIAAKIEAVNENISALEERVNNIESRLGAVEEAIKQIKALDIQFNVSGCITFDAGTDVFIEYTIVGGDNQTIVEAWGDGGWSAKVIAESSISGQIKVTPTDTPKGKVVVLATSGAGGVSMKSLYFMEGILEGVEDTYVVEWWATTLNIKLKTSLAYTVNIPTEAQSWLSVAETRATVRNETLTFSITENPEEMPARSASIDLIDRVGDIITSFTIIQKLQPSEDIIEFADKYVKQQCVSLFDTNGDGELSRKEASKVTSLPSNLFGSYSGAVKSFDEIKYFTGITEIERNAFDGCSSLTSISIPNSVTSIGDMAFQGCKSLTSSISIPDGVTEIEFKAFYGCSSLTSISIPNSVTSIGDMAFSYCSSLTSITIPDGVTKIGYYAFLNCSSLTSITIPDSVTEIDKWAFIACESLTSVYCKPTTPPSGGDAMFHDNASGRKIYVPTESVEEYKIVNGWKDYADDIEPYVFE